MRLDCPNAIINRAGVTLTDPIVQAGIALTIRFDQAGIGLTSHFEQAGIAPGQHGHTQARGGSHRYKHANTGPLFLCVPRSVSPSTLPSPSPPPLRLSFLRSRWQHFI